jgi:hypothetical protein
MPDTVHFDSGALLNHNTHDVHPITHQFIANSQLCSNGHNAGRDRSGNTLELIPTTNVNAGTHSYKETVSHAKRHSRRTSVCYA